MVDYTERLTTLKTVYGTYKSLSSSLSIAPQTLRKYRDGKPIPAQIRNKINRRWYRYASVDNFLYQWEATVDTREEKDEKIYSYAFALEEALDEKMRFELQLQQSSRIVNIKRYRLVRRKITDIGSKVMR